MILSIKLIARVHNTLFIHRTTFTFSISIHSILIYVAAGKRHHINQTQHIYQK